jgi:uncharacterized protein DUF6970
MGSGVYVCLSIGVLVLLFILYAHYCAGAEAHSSSVPPELIVKLSNDGSNKVSLYWYRDAVVLYVEERGSNDKYNEVYSLGGTLIGKTGGLTGKGDGKVADWYEEATHVHDLS